MFTERLIEISDECFIRGGIIQTLMRFDGIIEVNEAEKLNAPIGAVFKGKLALILCNMKNENGNIAKENNRIK